jgi:hypothetical protein
VSGDGYLELKVVTAITTTPSKGPRCSQDYFFFVFFAAFGFAAALDVGFFAFFFATMGMVTP